MENNAKSLNKLYGKLKKIYKKDIDSIVFVYESTGSYSTILESYAQEKFINDFVNAWVKVMRLDRFDIVAK